MSDAAKLDQIYADFQKAKEAGDIETAKRLKAEGQALEQQLASQQQEGPSAPTQVPDLAAASEKAIEKQNESLGSVDRFLIGTGKSLMSLWDGASQLLSSEEGAAEIAAKVKRERELFNALDKGQVGAEDVGEFVGEALPYLAGGGAAATVKGGVALGAIVEGIKAVEEDESRAANAVTGGLFGGAAGKLSASALAKSAEKEAARLGLNGMSDVLHKNALRDAAVAGATYLLGPKNMQRAASYGFVRGVSNMAHVASRAWRGKATDTAKPMAAVTVRGLVDSKKAALVAKRDAEIDKLGTEMLGRVQTLISQMSPKGRGALLNESTKQTLDDIARSATRTTSGGNLSLSYADFVKELPYGPELTKKISHVYAKQLRELIEEFGKRTDEIVGPEQIAAEVAKYNELIVNNGIDISSLPPDVRKTIWQTIKDEAKKVVTTRAAMAARSAAAGNAAEAYVGTGQPQEMLEGLQ